MSYLDYFSFKLPDMPFLTGNQSVSINLCSLQSSETPLKKTLILTSQNTGGAGPSVFVKGVSWLCREQCKRFSFLLEGAV